MPIAYHVFTLSLARVQFRFRLVHLCLCSLRRMIFSAMCCVSGPIDDSNVSATISMIMDATRAHTHTASEQREKPIYHAQAHPWHSCCHYRLCTIPVRALSSPCQQPLANFLSFSFRRHDSFHSRNCRLSCRLCLVYATFIAVGSYRLCSGSTSQRRAATATLRRICS